jgi:hypothetical protein
MQRKKIIMGEKFLNERPIDFFHNKISFVYFDHSLINVLSFSSLARSYKKEWKYCIRNRKKFEPIVVYIRDEIGGNQILSTIKDI